MKARVLISFFTDGARGSKDEVIEIKDQQTFDDLVKSGYIEAIDSPPTRERENVSTNPEELQVKKSRVRKVADSE